MSERYSAFVSYSHSDTPVARWLHRNIERFRFPKALRGTPSEFGPVPARLPPVFRDRDELAASGDLGSELRTALAGARFQIAVCSPRAARSKWVNEEILAFKRTHGEHRTLALILEGEPYAGGAEECFPPALRYHLAADGSLSDRPAEPIAADMRKGKDGRRLALLKLLAGIAGVRLDQLVRRDAVRRQRQLTALAVGSSAVAVTTIGLALYADGQRRVAEDQRAMAERSLAFLVGTFEIANPAKENPRTITALTILDRASARAEREFAARPQVAARLLRATGDIYYNLGLQAEAGRDLAKALALATTPSGRARALLRLAMLAQRGQNLAAMERYTAQARASYRSGDADAREFDALVREQQAFIRYYKADYARAAQDFAAAGAGFAELARTGTGEGSGTFQAKRLEMALNQARAEVQAGHPGRADRIFAAAVALAQRRFGGDDVRTAQANHNRAVALLEDGRADAGAAAMRGALAIYRRVLEPDHPNLAAAELLAGRIFAAQGARDASLAAFARARAIYIELYGHDNPAVGDVDFYTAEVESAAGRTAAALRRADNAKRIYDANYGPTDPDQAELLLLRARILAAATRLDEASANCRAAAALQDRLELGAATVAATHRFCMGLAART